MPTLREDIDAGLSLLPDKMRDLRARVLLYATNRQENPNRSPRQLINKGGKLVAEGPAVGDYQFERGGAVVDVMTRATSRTVAGQVLTARGVQPSTEAVFKALQTDPVLAAALARLNYYNDPHELPALGDEAGNWALYLRTWRPGAFARQPQELRAKWRGSYADAMKAYGL